MGHQKKKLALAISITPLLFSGLAIAQLEEIVVTAQKREQSLADVPISVAAVSGDAIEERGIESLASLSESIPNLYITESAIDSVIQVRGVRTGQNKGFEQSVAMYVDGIYYGRSQLIRLPLLDVERVEVLRGPQPTLFGKNAIAGAVSLTSAKPGDEFEGSISASYEFEHDEKLITAIVSGPMSDSLGGRLVVSSREMDEGYFTNQVLDQEQPQIEETFVRGALSWDVSEDLTLNLKGEFAEFDREGWPHEAYMPLDAAVPLYGFFGVELEQNYVNESSPVHSYNEVNNFVLNAEYALGDHTLTAISGWVDYETDELIDVDYIRLDLLDGTKQGEEYEQFSQEIRLTSPGGEKVDYIAGIYYQDNELIATDEVHFGAALLGSQTTMPAAFSYTDRFYTQDSTLWSVFAQADIHFTDDLTLTIGARYNDEDKEGRRILDIVAEPGNIGVNLPASIAAALLFPAGYTPSPEELAAAGAQLNAIYGNMLNLTLAGLNMWAHDISGDRNESSLNPLVNLQYQWNDEVMTYLSYSEGTKAGGWDIRGNSVPGHPVLGKPGTFEFADEQATSYELGAKLDYDNAEINIALFRTEYEDLQTQIFDGVLNFLVTNASASTIEGLEADGRFLLSEGLQMYGSFAYLDFSYDSFENGQCPYPLPGSAVCSLTGKRAPATPDWTANLGFDYDVALGDSLSMDANINFNYSDAYLLMPNQDPNSEQDSYTTVSAVLGIGSTDGKWRVSLVGDNLTDETIKVTQATLPLSGTLTGGAGTAYQGFMNRPRNIALKLDYSF